MKLDPFTGKIRTDRRSGPTLFVGVPSLRPVLRRARLRRARCGIDPSGRRVSEISYRGGAKSKGPSMSIKFEGKPPFYLGIAEVESEAISERTEAALAAAKAPEKRL